MFLSDITEQGAGPALVKTLAFQESRLKMIAENIANAQTPGYRAKQLDVAGFQGSLREALKNRGSRSDRKFEVRSGDEVSTDEQGFLTVKPSEEPVENVLFHDGTNVSIERQMADLAQTGLWSDLASKFLRDRFEGLRKAIRGSA
jgi:flagellar basal-body rod protein FlgB